MGVVDAFWQQTIGEIGDSLVALQVPVWNILYLLQYYHLTYPPFSPFLVLGSLLSETMFSVLRLVVNLSFFFCPVPLYGSAFFFFLLSSFSPLPLRFLFYHVPWSKNRFHGLLPVTSTIPPLSCCWVVSTSTVICSIQIFFFFFFPLYQLYFFLLTSPFSDFLQNKSRLPLSKLSTFLIILSHHYLG